MTQTEIDNAIASVTGERVAMIHHLGFGLADPMEVEYEPEPRNPLVLDWDMGSAAYWPGCKGYKKGRAECQLSLLLAIGSIESAVRPIALFRLRNVSPIRRQVCPLVWWSIVFCTSVRGVFYGALSSVEEIHECHLDVGNLFRSKA